MADLDQDQSTSPAIAADMSNKKKEFLSTAMKRTSEWIFSLEIPSDATVDTGRTSFSLHKFPLVSKCGYIRKLVLESTIADLSVIEIPDVPGGGNAFELAAKFCYGINFEISTENIAMLRCAAEYLEMTEEYAVGNLIRRTEAYINEVALKTLAGSVTVLHSCEDLLPIAEEVQLVSRCMDRIAFLGCKDNQFGTPAGKNDLVLDWWGEDLTILRVDFFRRVLIAMIARGLKQQILGRVLELYAQKSLQNLEVFGKGWMKIDPRHEHEKRVVVETIVGLLPRETNTVSVSFLSMLLRAAIYLETTVACRLDLEKRMASELAQATLADLLIPSYSLTGDTLFDVEAVQRIMTMHYNNAGQDLTSQYPNEVERVTRLIENYLCEVATDRNLSVSKFISLAELIPKQSRITEDGIYRTIDIYLKAHPTLSDMERKKICSVMDCQKLSREACAHAAQNDRLPVQTIVQMLYYEQQRLREAMDDTLSQSPAGPPRLNRYSVDIYPVTDEVVSLRKENQDLKLELVKMKNMLEDMENSADYNLLADRSPLELAHTQKLHLPWKSLLSSVSRKLGRFIWADGKTTQSSKVRNKTIKQRRHSIS
ncbi:hypothetical protein CDL12_26878 [Handroanthus impetiginosus]|uniref:Uncharacterized protein n=1 Tax=Handroanthus impetiginosus TaxID=429701 RepID=A0A2G9G5N3_9LAMI|nr:hypothetical protein CDL12_26878 [Handroanthus impetiginosus]